MRTRHSRPAPVPRPASAGFCFPPEVIVLAVRWYPRFLLSYRDVEELLAERGIEVDHVTVYRWVVRFTPLLAEAARPCRHQVGDRWQVDETYVKAAGRAPSLLSLVLRDCKDMSRTGAKSSGVSGYVPAGPSR
jgi:transposase, IS6 family